MSKPQGAHLVGSINLDTVEETITLAATELGEHLKRIPDGEVGERFHWIVFQAQRLARSEGIRHIGEEPNITRGVDFRPVFVEEGRDVTELTIQPLGYAEAALSSYATFARLKQEGVVPSTTRFQVSLPTPLGVVGSMVVPEDRYRFEPVYEQALARELDEILSKIPNQELAIQWDAAVEFGFLEGKVYGQPAEAWFDDVWAGTSDRLARQIDRIPEAVEVGVHLCYGDVSETHFVEPTDTSILTRFANIIVEKATRQINWIHLPVPIERDDEDYFAPLIDLNISSDTELYLGLVHRQDGVEGARRRVLAANSSLKRPYGIGTECGFGRAPEGTTKPLFEIHREIASSW